MATVTISWHGDLVKKQTDDQITLRLDRIGFMLENKIKENLSRGRRGSIGDFRSTIGEGEPPHIDTGRLRNSIVHYLTEDGRSVVVGTTLLYGLFLELGARVMPKTAKMLAIPMSPDAKRHSVGGGSPRDFPKPLVKIKTPHALLLVEKGARKISPDKIHYVLTGSATIPPHPFIKPALDGARTEIEKILMA